MNFEKNIIKLLYPNRRERPKILDYDYLFENLSEIKKYFSNQHNKLDTYLIQKRWHTTLGKEIYRGVQDFIEQQIKTQSHPSNTVPLRIDNKIEKTQKPIVLDFQAIYINYKGSSQHINDLQDKFKTSKFRGYADLRGFDFQNRNFFQIYIRNGHFPNSNFKNCSFNLVKFENCYFQWCNFENSKLIANTYTNTTFSGANLKYASIDNIDSKSITDIKYNKIGYIQILYQSLRMLFKKDFKVEAFKENRFTYFQNIKIENATNIENEENNDYFFWFERFRKNIRHYSNKNFIKRISLFFIVMMTKMWKSFSYLLLSSLILNILYTVIYMFSYKQIKGLSTFTSRLFSAIVDAFYFSIITFTTLGFGDISPSNDWLKLVVISEVLLGYTILGIFIFLLSNRLSKNVIVRV